MKVPQVYGPVAPPAGARVLARQQGAALLPCAMLLMAVLMLAGASLRAARSQHSAVLVHADRVIARNAAEAALLDGRQHLMIVDDPLSFAGSGVEHEFGSVTGRSFAEAGKLQSARPPSYRIDVMSATAATGICRVSATGTGLQPHTEVRLQADFQVSACDPDQPDEQQPEPTRHCIRELRQLAWREVGGE